MCSNFQRKMVEFLGTEILFLLMIIKSSLEGLQKLAQLFDLPCLLDGLSGSLSEDGSTSRISVDDRPSNSRRCLSFCQPFYGYGYNGSYDYGYYDDEEAGYDDGDVYYSNMPSVGDGQMDEMTADMKSRQWKMTEPENRLSFSYYGDIHAFCYLWTSLCGALQQSSQVGMKKPRKRTTSIVQTDDNDDSSARDDDDNSDNKSEAGYVAEDDSEDNAEDYESLGQATDYKTAEEGDIVEYADGRQGVKYDDDEVKDKGQALPYEGDTIESLSTATGDV